MRIFIFAFRTHRKFPMLVRTRSYGIESKMVRRIAVRTVNEWMQVAAVGGIQFFEHFGQIARSGETKNLTGPHDGSS